MLTMDENKLNMVRTYLSGEFEGATIEEKYDVDLSAQIFQVRVGRDDLLLKICENFLSDHNEAQIGNQLENWKVADRLRENKELGIFVGNHGPTPFKRFW